MSATTRRHRSVAFGRGAGRARSFPKQRKGYHGHAKIAFVTEQNYWVRTEHGRVWGPYPLEKLERLRGQLTEECEASLDGKTWQPGVELPELRPLLAPARKLERPPPPRLRHTPPGGQPPTLITPPQGQAPVAAAVPPPPVVPAGPEAAPEVPEQGDLAQLSPVRLYALAAITSSSGWLQLELEKQRMLQISFRRGTPEHLSSDDPELSLLRFLQGRGVVAPASALAAEEQAAKAGQDIVSVLFQMQLIPPSDAHRLLGEHAGFLLDRALLTFRGKFNFEKDAPPPPGAFPLGSRWTLLAESVRRLDPAVLRARMGKKLLRPVVRSGGLGVGKVEELALNAQEARLYSGIDGTRSGEELLKASDPTKTLRLLYLLTELGHLAFADSGEQATAEKPPAPPPPAVPSKPPARELPKIARPAPPPEVMARLMTPPPTMKVPPAAPKPASAASAPPKPAPIVARPPTGPIPIPKSTPPPPAIPANHPTPAFAIPPEGETPGQALIRLSALLEKLDKANHFEVLGMPRQGASSAESKRNFFVLAKELHPDTVSDPGQGALREVKERLFARINAASQVLADDKKRKEYEEELDGKASSVDVARIFAAEENFQRAEILIKARKYKEGLGLLEKAIGMNDQEAEFYAWRGYAKFLLSADRKAIFPETSGDCRKAIKMQEKCTPAHLFLGHMAKALGDLKLAVSCYQRVLQLDPKHVEAQREMRLMGKKS
jgi:hypothetical protein